MPFSGELGNFSVVDESCNAITPGTCEAGYSGDLYTLAFQSWSDPQIVVGGYSQQAGSKVATPGDAVEIGIWNASSQAARAGFVYGGNLPPVSPGTPQVSSVLLTGSGANLHIKILGSGFGSTPPPNVPGSLNGTPYVGFTTNLRFSDYAGRIPQATQSVAFRAGYENPVNKSTDPISVSYAYWSDTEIDLGGFEGQYGSNNLVVESGDPIAITIWSTANSLATAWGGYVP